MCSIVGYVGFHDGVNYVFSGLRRLEYRGYDSAGCAGVASDQQIHIHKCVGGVDALSHTWPGHVFSAQAAIGHTRWATHGQATYHNAHPHTNLDETLAIVHNGIIENEQDIRAYLHIPDDCFFSDTDSELLAHLLHTYIQEYGDAKRALMAVMHHVVGAYAFCAVSRFYPGYILLARRESPLCIGIGTTGYMVASDVAGCAVHADQVVYMPEESCALVSQDTLEIYDRAGSVIRWQASPIYQDVMTVDRLGYEHYMLKEMYEQKQVVQDTVEWLNTRYHTLVGANGPLADISSWASVTMVACGTSYYASAIGAHYIQEIASLPAYARIASEFRYQPHMFGDNDCCMFLSQSGETADTREALRSVQACGAPTCGIVNVPASSIERHADGVLYTYARQEMSVASTKSFTAQLALLYWISYVVAFYGAEDQSTRLSRACDDLVYAACLGDDALRQHTSDIQQYIAPLCASASSVIFLGKHAMYPFAQEAALKLQELAYIPSYAYPAGELKHGPLALITKDVPVVMFSSPDPVLYRKLIASAQEIRARGGTLIVYAFEGQHELMSLAHISLVFTETASSLSPFVFAPAMQALAYYTAYYLQRPIDKPRHLAKSVTVE